MIAITFTRTPACWIGAASDGTTYLVTKLERGKYLVTWGAENLGYTPSASAGTARCHAHAAGRAAQAQA